MDTVKLHTGSAFIVISDGSLPAEVNTYNDNELLGFSFVVTIAMINFHIVGSREVKS